MHINDKTTTLQILKDIVQKFTQERNWEKFHSPKDLSMYLSIEVSELMTHFLWVSKEESILKLEKNRNEVENEIADVMYWILQFCWQHNIDLSSVLMKKIEQNTLKYSIEKSKDNTKKYSEL